MCREALEFAVNMLQDILDRESLTPCKAIIAARQYNTTHVSSDPWI
jgi:hypothetical protein